VVFDKLHSRTHDGETFATGSSAPVFSPRLRLLGYPPPCIGDRLKLANLVYCPVSPFRLDVPLSYFGRFNLSRLEYWPRTAHDRPP
jgi:hypothetical protein